MCFFFSPLLLTLSAPRENAMATRTQGSEGRMLLGDDKGIFQEVLRLQEMCMRQKLRLSKDNNKRRGEETLKKAGLLGERIKFYERKTK